MISFAIATALYAVSMQASATVQPRKNFAACLDRVAKKSLQDKVEPSAFEAAVRSACAAEEAAFKKAMVDYDVSMKIARSRAEQDAQLQVEDYLATRKDTYQMHFEAASPPK